ncbi:MAG: hypothetical protein JRJ47_13790 [Deltaproteobacteria bacterium]|nr:hypothetical protein [Deltaproteobacteria bacterium]
MKRLLQTMVIILGFIVVTSIQGWAQDEGRVLICMGNLKGDAGPQGPQGEKGEDGELPSVVQNCAEGEFATGFDDDGNVVCSKIGPDCSGSECGTNAPSVASGPTNPPDPVPGELVALSLTVDDEDNAPGCDMGQSPAVTSKFVDMPAGSTAKLKPSVGLTPAFTPDVAGDYIVRSTVTDDTGCSSFTNTLVTVIIEISISDAPPVYEGSGNFASFTVTLDQPSPSTVTVEYETMDGTGSSGAKSGEDFIYTTGTLTFSPGETIKTIQVEVIDDNTLEGLETFFVNLSNPSANATIIDGQGLGTILDGGGGPPPVS